MILASTGNILTAFVSLGPFGCPIVKAVAAPEVNDRVFKNYLSLDVLTNDVRTKS